MTTQEDAAQKEFAHRDWDGGLGARWARNLDPLEAMMTEAGFAAMDALPAPDGAHALDLGCGGGTTSFALAERRPAGRVTGLDISGALLEQAEARRAAHAAGDRVRFVKADAAGWTAPAPLDALFSRCGCMFFGDERAAFANLRAQMAPGAPMALLAWGARADCAWGWMAQEALAELLPGPVPPRDAPVPDAPGPFRWGEIDPRLAMLQAAGWRDVAARGIRADTPISLGDGAPEERAARSAMTLGPAAEALAGASEAVRRDAAARLAEAFAPHVSGDVVRLPARAWIVTARA